jgi:hypothetical protein
MNIDFKSIKQKAIWFLASLMLLSSCLQGPWDYVPEDPDLYKGIWVYGHVIADQPVRKVCFEKLRSLKESYTTAFAFYESANVEITGAFSDGSSSINLSPINNSPNCFNGPADVFPIRDQDYNLDATLIWDSLGQRVNSRFRGTAQIPAFFKLDSATAPSQAFLGGTQLTPEVIAALLAEFGTEAQNALLDPESAAEFLQENQDKIVSVIEKFKTPYQSGDSVYYMTGPYNFTSHYFLTRQSADVGGVLMTNVFDSTGYRPETVFDDLFGLGVDSSGYFEVGNNHRLQYLQALQIGNFNLLDSVPFPNISFLSGENTIYLYASDSAYSDYVQTTIQENDNAKVKKVYNIEGGKGIFTGLIVDSIKVYVLTTSDTKTYPLGRAKVLTCKGESRFAEEKKPIWFDENFCRNYYWQYCSDVNYQDKDCYPASINNALDSGWVWNSIIDTLDALTGKSFKNDTLSSARNVGEMHYCIRNDFPTDMNSCDAFSNECLVGNQNNTCRIQLWNFCMDRNWDINNHPQCGTALVSYYRESNIISPEFKRVTEQWCRDYPSDPQCGI